MLLLAGRTGAELHGLAPIDFHVVSR